ncbi:hypothetical protein JCM14244_12890 [Venenivibrio stagnispumantis]|uniref:Anti-sigma-28 factor, FlgM family n=1 Tax=Venenivibrio stagnispumantis TaxID=407998 RepID=A0AA46AEW5_9AQUI|nr:flagellar biosynthesis anti-sigma factor FlgM [Venenivibrio stagnispumantis]MCW4573765.1 flagellar biosynthesis anti-sigma factor FlgM [Venenivibrio stagnispumantis]SMP15052.1 anti-sigma-28 factor, FlgM family [Venenivibrio stagnispumantis]
MDKEMYEILKKYLSEEEIEKIENILEKELDVRKEKIIYLRELIQKGDYKVDVEALVEKILDFYRKKN